MSSSSSYLNTLEKLVQRKEFNESEIDTSSTLGPPLKTKQKSQTDVMPTTDCIKSDILLGTSETQSNIKFCESYGTKLMKRNGYYCK